MWSQSREQSSGCMMTVDVVRCVMKAVIWLFIKDIRRNSKPLLNELFKVKQWSKNREREKERKQKWLIALFIHKSDLILILMTVQYYYICPTTIHPHMATVLQL